MENTRIGNLEAVALMMTVMANHSILNTTKTIITSTSSAAILNTIYISIIALLLSYIICRSLSKFPTFDIIDISNFLGGKILKVILSILFLSYFIFFSANLLKAFAYFLQTIYFTSTHTFFIMVVFLITSVLVCNLKNNSIFRSNLLTIPLVIFSIILLFLGNIGDFTFINAFPFLGYGSAETFLIGINNLFAFQGLIHLLFLPPHLKDVTKLKKITLLSISMSALYLIFSVGIIVLLFDPAVTNTLLMPLYSAARYIEFGAFIQRLDSIFILIWIISFVSYISIIVSTCHNILRKVTQVRSTKFSSTLIGLIILVVTFFSQSYGTVTFIINTVYQYGFFIILGISLIVMFIASIVKSIKSRKSNKKTNPKTIVGGAM